MKPMLASNLYVAKDHWNSWFLTTVFITGYTHPPIPTQHPLLVLFICLVSIFGPLLLHSDVIRVPNSFP